MGVGCNRRNGCIPAETKDGAGGASVPLEAVLARDILTLTGVLGHLAMNYLLEVYLGVPSYHICPLVCLLVGQLGFLFP